MAFPVGDGNCFIHGLINQMSYDPILSVTMRTYTKDAQKMREYIVNSVDDMIAMGKFDEGAFVTDFTSADGDVVGSKDDWKAQMIVNREFCDDRFIAIAASVLERTIILYPVIEQGYNNIIVHPEYTTPTTRPFYLLYFDERNFVGHYQRHACK